MIKNIKEFMSYFKTYYHFGGRRVFILFITSFSVALMDSIGISLLITVFAKFLGGESGIVSNNNGKFDKLLSFFGVNENFAYAISFVFLVFLIKSIINFINIAATGNIIATMRSHIRKRLITHYSALDYIPFKSVNVGKIANTLTQEVNVASGSFKDFANIVISIINALVYISIALALDWKLSSILLVAGLILFRPMLMLSVNSRKLSLKTTKTNNSLNSLVVQFLYSFKYLKATNNQKKLIKIVNTRIVALETYQKKLSVITGLSKAVIEFVSVTLILILSFIQVKIIGGELDSFMIVIILLYRMSISLFNIQNNWQTYQAKSGSLIQVIQEYDRVKGDHKEKNSLPKLKEEVLFESQIEVRDVCFKFPDSDAVILDKVSLTIKKGEKVGIVGPSGSGKSTLMNILTGLIVPDQGSMFIDNVNSSEMNWRKWRNELGYVTQETELFNDTILNNISLWDDTIPKEQVLEQAKHVAIRSASIEYIESTPNGFDSHIGDRGDQLSGGQRQRLTLARELYRNPKLVLFDEGTAAIDKQSEALIIDNIMSLLDTTVIMIAHRIETLKGCDKIIVMKNGKVVDVGTYNDLMQFSELFKKLAHNE